MNKSILIGITGSIAAYKSVDVVSALRKSGWEVYVVMSEAATKFITPFTLEVMSQHKVIIDTFDEPSPDSIYHVDLIKKVDVILLAPATAHTISKIAMGLGDNMLSNLMLVGHDKKKLFAPAMNTNMYTNPVIKNNIETLKNIGWQEIEPKTSLLACGDYGQGAMANVDDIVTKINGLVE